MYTTEMFNLKCYASEVFKIINGNLRGDNLRQENCLENMHIFFQLL